MLMFLVKSPSHFKMDLAKPHRPANNRLDPIHIPPCTLPCLFARDNAKRLLYVKQQYGTYTFTSL